jgi:hypothetical protein
MIADGAIVQRSPAVIWDRVDGAVTLCNPETAELFRLNEAGGMIWELCDGRTREEILIAVAARYPSVPRERIEGTIHEYLAMLAGEGLIQDLPSGRNP